MCSSHFDAVMEAAEASIVIIEEDSVTGLRMSAFSTTGDAIGRGDEDAPARPGTLQTLTVGVDVAEGTAAIRLTELVPATDMEMEGAVVDFGRDWK